LQEEVVIMQAQDTSKEE